MRFLFGIIVGAALTVGLAYAHDNVSFGRNATVTRPMIVNWDVVASLWSSASNQVVSQVHTLSR